MTTTERRAIATWSSKGGKRTAELIKGRYGYDLRELKHGDSCGCAFRPNGTFTDDSDAIEWAEGHVRNSFDVPMRRTQP